MTIHRPFPTHDKSKSVVFFSSSGAQGGAERQLANLLNHFKYSTIYLVILDHHKFLDSVITNPSVRIIRFTRHRISFFGSLSRFFFLLSFIAADKSESLVLIGWMARANLLTYFICILLTPFKKISLIWNHRSSFLLFQSFSSQVLLFVSLLISFVSPKKIIHITNSSSVFDPRFVRFMIRGPKYVIYNGFEFKDSLSFAYPVRNPPFSTIDSSHPIRLLYPARFSPEKGHSILFEALRLAPFSFELTLVGTGCSCQNASLMKQISAIHGNVVCKESSKSIFEDYISSHYTLLFSYSESFPNILVESMSVATPCICTNVGDSQAILGGHGFLLDEHTPNAALSALISAYNFLSTPAYSEMCANAKSHVIKKYPIDKMIASFQSIL